MSLQEDIQHNCNVSDARDHGIYSMCIMILKLRNLYKWEHGLEPWQEAEPADLLKWIDAKEQYWASLAEEPYRSVQVADRSFSPDRAEDINRAISLTNMVYGAGYGRSMKAVFFLAERVREYTVAAKPVIILGRESVREMASPFAMAQEGVVYIRRYSLRFFLWDQIQELRSLERSSLRRALKLHGLLKEGRLSQDRFRQRLDDVVETEMNLFIYHEIGELLQTTLDSSTLEKIITAFPGTVIELVCRTIKDILADTHPSGLLGYIIREERESSLGFYLGFLDGLRKNLFPEIVEAWDLFEQTGSWKHIEDARKRCHQKNLALADAVVEIAAKIGRESNEEVKNLFNSRVIEPLGLAAAG
ncbi:MAG TPA: hypothetical protein VJ969_02100 [Desulfopila sp.]|nr:hypothetical protein [Desulfopila sp.]